MKDICGRGIVPGAPQSHQNDPGRAKLNGFGPKGGISAFIELFLLHRCLASQKKFCQS